MRVSACVCASACVPTSLVSILPNSGGPRTHSTSDMVYASRTPPSRGNGRYHGRRVGREELMTGLCKQPRQSITTTTTTTRAAAQSQHNTNTHHTHAARMLMLPSHDVFSCLHFMTYDTVSRRMLMPPSHDVFSCYHLMTCSHATIS